MKPFFVQWFAPLVFFVLVSGCSVFGGSNQVEVPDDIPVTGKIEIDLQRMDRGIENIASVATELKQARVIVPGSDLDQRVGDLLDKANQNMREAWRLFDIGKMAEAEDQRELVRRTWFELREELVQAQKEKGQ